MVKLDCTNKEIIHCMLLAFLYYKKKRQSAKNKVFSLFIAILLLYTVTVHKYLAYAEAETYVNNNRPIDAFSSVMFSLKVSVLMK